MWEGWGREESEERVGSKRGGRRVLDGRREEGEGVAGAERGGSHSSHQFLLAVSC